MLTTRIIPCLDIKKEMVAKGIKFQELKSVGDPVVLSRKYYEDGADELVFLDVSATIEGRKTILNIVKKVAEQIFIPLSVGGGIRSVEDAAAIFSAGAEKVAINTAGVSDPTLITKIADAFGSQSIVVSIDAAKQNNNKWEIYVNAGTKPTGIDAIQWAQEAEQRGAGEILLTSIDRDGTMSGYDLELTSRVAEAVHIPVIASGGGGDIKSMVEAVNKGKADAILLASILHYGTMSIQEIKSQLRLNKILVR
jgi:cyclase